MCFLLSLSLSFSLSLPTPLLFISSSRSSCLCSLSRFHSISLHAAAPLPYAISLMQSELNRVSIVPTLNDCLLPASNSVPPSPSFSECFLPLEVRYLAPIACNLAVANCVAFGWLQHQSLSFAIKCSLVQRLASCHTASLPPLLPLATPRCRCSSSRTIIIPARLHFF